MVLNVYTTPEGRFVLLPIDGSGLQAALRSHGPLEYCARIEQDDYPYPELWTRVSTELAERRFALLDATVGKWLMELDCPTAGLTPGATSAA